MHIKEQDRQALLNSVKSALYECLIKSEQYNTIQYNTIQYNTNPSIIIVALTP